MAKAVFTLRSGVKVGRAALGAHGDVQGSVRQQAHDGDTVIVDPDGNLGLRFLGVDAPEVSFTLPGSDAFVSIAKLRRGRVRAALRHKGLAHQLTSGSGFSLTPF